MEILRRTAYLVLPGILLLSTSCARLSALDAISPAVGIEKDESFAGRESRCRPEFSDRGGWLGGDAAYSIPLPPSRVRTSLWLFGDSFVTHRSSKPERQYPFVHNSIALSECSKDGTLHVEHFWGQELGPEPGAFFVPEPEAPWIRRLSRASGGNGYYWPADGFVANGALFVGLLRIGDSEPRGPLRLPFRILGVDLARVENFEEAPRDWKIQISTLSESSLAFPGIAFALNGDHVYAFAFFDRGDGRAPRMLSRMPLAALDRWTANLSDNLETLNTDDKWHAGFDPESAKILMDDDASEMSVHFDTGSQEWIAVYNHPIRYAIADQGGGSAGESGRESGRKSNEGAGTGRIHRRRATSLEGPWTPPEAIAEIPETRTTDSADRDENLFCYAAKAHPQFSAPKSLIVTYVCNLYARSPDETLDVLLRLKDTPSLYRPRTLVVATP